MVRHLLLLVVDHAGPDISGECLQKCLDTSLNVVGILEDVLSVCRQDRPGHQQTEVGGQVLHCPQTELPQWPHFQPPDHGATAQGAGEDMRGRSVYCVLADLAQRLCRQMPA